MKATDLLKKDHQEVKKLFKAFESSKDSPDEARQICEQVAQELTVHSAIEEELFYPELQPYEEAEEIVEESVEEHHVVDVLLGELRGLEPEDEAFAAKFQVLSENVLHHAEEEERELFPKAERLLGKDRLGWLGERLTERKSQLLAEAGGGPSRRTRA